jgi:hypothetical protein
MGHHDVAPGEVRNQGFGFSHCRLCGRDMMRSDQAWRTVPKGFRVVWRYGIPRQTQISATQLLFDLPEPDRALTLPKRGRRSRLSDLLGLAMIAAQFLSFTAAERWRSWRKAAFSRREAHLSPIRLAAGACPGSHGIAP